MHFVFLAPDGTEYGPVGIDVLRQWAAEGRVLPHNNLRIMETGNIVVASSIPNLFPSALHQPPMAQGSAFSAPYDPYGIPMDTGSRELGLAWAYAGGGLVVCCPIFSIFGIIYGVQALRKGNPSAKFAIAANVAGLIIGGIVLSVLQQALGFGG